MQEWFLHWPLVHARCLSESWAKKLSTTTWTTLTVMPKEWLLVYVSRFLDCIYVACSKKEYVYYIYKQILLLLFVNWGGYTVQPNISFSFFNLPRRPSTAGILPYSSVANHVHWKGLGEVPCKCLSPRKPWTTKICAKLPRKVCV